MSGLQVTKVSISHDTKARHRGDAFDLYISYSTHREEWGTKHPDRGARFLARMSRGAAPKTPGYDGALAQRPR